MVLGKRKLKFEREQEDSRVGAGHWSLVSSTQLAVHTVILAHRVPKPFLASEGTRHNVVHIYESRQHTHTCKINTLNTTLKRSI